MEIRCAPRHFRDMTITASRTPLTVFHDGSCPLCAREIGMYQRSEGGETIAWCDVSLSGAPLPGMTPDEAMARFHVMDADGVVKSGAAAFIALWLTLPRWRWLGRVASVPPLPIILEGLYRAFLPVRPTLQRLARWWN
jgi:predicted DCC family thiol-disulfide oxidoreductase YuxK